MTDLLVSATHRMWLAEHSQNLLAFGRHCALSSGGAGWLDDTGAVDSSIATYTWITARMAHVYSVGALLRIPGSAPIAQRALDGLCGVLHDEAHGGWFHSVGTDGTAAVGKSCYDHAFVLLAASSGVLAGVNGAAGLLDNASTLFLERFWDESSGLCVDTWDDAFTECATYRGINANMHAVEAMLAAAGVTGDSAWLDRAMRICRFVVDVAAENDWRLPEHYDERWTPILEFNRDKPDDRFKPYGATVGHGLEWSRLLLHLEAAFPHGHSPWLERAAVRLFDRAVADGWHADGTDGFVYTTEWNGSPVVRDRLHWVIAEAINAAAVLYRRTGELRYRDLYHRYWDHAAEHFIDREHGSWHHQLTPENVPTDTVWAGKPDIYHAFQATLGPRLPLYPMIAVSASRGELE